MLDVMSPTCLLQETSGTAVRDFKTEAGGVCLSCDSEYGKPAHHPAAIKGKHTLTVAEGPMCVTEPMAGYI